jgi:hypothetical protein
MDDAFNEYWKDDVGHLFFFEALPGHDDDVRELLFQACDWLTAAGARTARLSYHYGWQLPMTTDAYDVRPTLFHTYNPAYYHGYIKSGGFSTEKGLAEYRVRFTPELAERYRKMLDYAAETGAGLRSWNFDRMEEENAHFGELYRATYDNVVDQPARGGAWARVEPRDGGQILPRDDGRRLSLHELHDRAR